MEKSVLYLKESFGLQVQSDHLSSNDESLLPLNIKGNFHFLSLMVEHKTVWLMQPRREQTPDMLQRQQAVMAGLVSHPVVFVLNEVKSWERKRLIEKKVSFMEPYRQLFVPALLMELSDVRKQKSVVPNNEGPLSAVSQLAILYHLQKKSIENRPLGELSVELGYSPMTVSRVVSELLSKKLISVSGNKEKHILFEEQGKALWLKVLPLLSSPVREIWYVSEPLDKSLFKISGDDALAKYSDLAEGEASRFAISREKFREQRSQKMLGSLDKHKGEAVIEVWNYPPEILTANKFVDALSLYLTYSDEVDDDRVRIALDQLVNAIKWSKD